MAERLTVGVAARLSRYLQVLTQARKMGKDRISSQEIAEYTNINATQIRRDLSAFGQVRQARRRLPDRRAARRDPEDPAHAGPAQHRARRRRPARERDRELADLRRARDHDRRDLRERPGEGRPARRRPRGELHRRPRRDRRASETSSSASSPFRRRARRTRPTRSSAPACKIIFNYSEALLDMPADVQVHTSNPAVDLLYALYFHLTWRVHAREDPLWHGYLLGGTGSNVYTRQLAREWSATGHDVTVLCQDPHPERYDLGGAEVVRPDVGRLLPVFVLDRVRGLRGEAAAGLLARRARRAGSRRTPRRVRERLPADLVFCNHVLLGGPSGRRRARRTRSRRTARSSSTRCADGRSSRRGGARCSRARTRRSSARRTSARCSRRSAATSSACTRCRRAWTSRRVAAASRATRRSPRCVAEARRDPPNPGNASERLPGRGQRRAARGVPRGRRARPSSTSGSSSTTRASTCCSRRLRGLDARAVIVGFGDYRERAREPGRRRERRSSPGPLEHRHLVHLLALADACVVPSIFPEAFGMVAAEAAAAGCPPLVARHSGLAEIAEGLEAEYPPELRGLASLRDRRRRTSCGRSSRGCSRSRPASARRFGPRRAGRRSSAGAGAAWPSGCSRSDR